MAKKDRHRTSELAATRAEIEALRVEVDRLQSVKDEISLKLGELRAQLTQASAELLERVPAPSNHLDTLRDLVMAAEYRDHDTGAHLVRIGYLCALLAPLCGCDTRHTRLLMMAAPMHDVGKIVIPDHVLKKQGALEQDERRIMERHAEYGASILAGSDAPVLRMASEIALTHHEHFDGTGYPRGLKGKDIPLSGRIVAVADVFDAVAMDRSYRAAMPVQRAVGLIQEGRGSHFDPDVVDAFSDSIDEILTLREHIHRGERPNSIPGVTDVPGGNPLDFYDPPLRATSRFLAEYE